MEWMTFDPHTRVLHTTTNNTSDLEARRRAWVGLLRGEYEVAERAGMYLFRTRAHATHDVLTVTEAAVARAAANESTGKAIAGTLGLARSTVSMTLGSAAAKLGLRSSTDLTRLVRALFTNDADLDWSMLTPAERDVLALILEGRSNADIASARGRSIRTIANQVASILRKTKNPSRRALRVKA
jgi:DNA-binding CsgD family transcriptional regulator